jgi:hypothetical protein
MGIKGLYETVHKNHTNRIKSCTLEDLKGKRIAFDVPILLYRYCYGNQPGSHIIQVNFKNYMNNNYMNNNN